MVLLRDSAMAVAVFQAEQDRVGTRSNRLALRRSSRYVQLTALHSVTQLTDTADALSYYHLGGVFKD